MAYMYGCILFRVSIYRVIQNSLAEFKGREVDVEVKSKQAISKQIYVLLCDY